MRRGATVVAIPFLIALAVTALATSAISGPKFASKWSMPHDPNERLSGRRPECPRHWGTVPLFLDSVRARRELERTRRPGPRQAGLINEGGRAAFTTGGAAWSQAVPAGPIVNVAGPITDIPEFHDCQKFNDSQRGKFDSLFAIFASYRLETVMNALARDSVTWSTSAMSIATVDTAGTVKAISAGAVLVTATSKIEPDRKATVSVLVVSNPPVSMPDSISTSMPGPFTLGIGDSVTIVAELGAPTQTTHAAATIYSYGPGYGPLGIGPNFNCMYLYFDGEGALRAKMFPVVDLSTAVDACFRARRPTDPGKELRVIRVPGRTTGKQAPVARWDWDATNRQQYIGIACGAAWCEVGPKDVPFAPSPGYSAAPGAPIGAARVIENKGWYDEQDLAMPGPDPDPLMLNKKSLIPSGLIGTVIPDPELASQDSSDYSKPWVQVAYIALDAKNAKPGAVAHYWNLLNLRPATVDGDLGSLNRLAFCFGSREHCTVPAATVPRSAACGPEKSFFGFENSLVGWPIERWWVRITSANAADPVMYRCVTRRGHDGFTGNIAETARWRWILGDDITWTECTQGCCETGIS